MPNRRGNMAKVKNSKRKQPVKPSPKIKYEDTLKFIAFDHMMRSNRGIWVDQ